MGTDLNRAEENKPIWKNRGQKRIGYFFSPAHWKKSNSDILDTNHLINGDLDRILKRTRKAHTLEGGAEGLFALREGSTLHGMTKVAGPTKCRVFA